MIRLGTVVRHSGWRVWPQRRERSCKKAISIPFRLFAARARAVPVPVGFCPVRHLWIPVGRAVSRSPCAGSPDTHSAITRRDSTLAKWVGQSAALLQPLVEAIRRHVMAASNVATKNNRSYTGGKSYVEKTQD